MCVLSVCVCTCFVCVCIHVYMRARILELVLVCNSADLYSSNVIESLLTVPGQEVGFCIFNVSAELKQVEHITWCTTIWKIPQLLLPLVLILKENRGAICSLRVQTRHGRGCCERETRRKFIRPRKEKEELAISGA